MAARFTDEAGVDRARLRWVHQRMHEVGAGLRGIREGCVRRDSGWSAWYPTHETVFAVWRFALGAPASRRESRQTSFHPAARERASQKARYWPSACE